MTSQTRSDPELWNEQIDWFLSCSAAALGARGTMGAVINAVERGGMASNGAFAHDAMLTAIGWEMAERAPGECKPGARTHRNVERAKRLAARWAKLTPRSAAILSIHYGARPGAPGAHVEDATYAARSMVEQALGQCARVALYLAKEPLKLLRACDAQGSTKMRKAAKDAAELAVRSAHREWQQLGRTEAEAWVA